MSSNRKKTINLFAIGIILLVAVPEIVGHSLFEKPHPENSSVVAAMALASKIGTGKHSGPTCNLIIQEDPSGAKIARVAGLYGKYGNFTCNNP
ncbi:hypothetical protein [Candidatus Nitrosotalea bavarica]|uniref:hypothetical protein n=1 Tax=Candidatus Nitrosotalea bavarica TaxID=1903277 RepID=UPI000C711393|nr:hypothetical protein [Candidatus Nitrosotalea bavarica]